MSRRLAVALMATMVAACNGHAPDPAPPGHGPVHVAPARGDGEDDGAAQDGAIVAPPPLAVVRPLDQDLPRLAERAVAMLHAVAAGLDAAGDDCPAAVARLGEVQVAYADVVAANARVARADRHAELLAAMAPQQTALDAAAAAVFRSRAVGTCMDQPAFAAAFDRALGAPGPP